MIYNLYVITYTNLYKLYKQLYFINKFKDPKFNQIRSAIYAILRNTLSTPLVST